jgi:hypothetical protein
VVAATACARLNADLSALYLLGHILCIWSTV